MHGEAPTKHNDDSIPRKMNECLDAIKYPAPSGHLFDEFWREGELALLFGAAGTGKSILATQIAEGIGRGRGVDGFRITATRKKVLYVDLKLTAERFKERYSRQPQKRYRFSENFYRARPASIDGKTFAGWLREAIEKRSIQVVVIDDLSAIRTTCDGTRETLKLMRELKELKNELGISILVLSGAREPGRGRYTSESDLQRSRVLCDEADSVFAIGLHPNAPENRYLIQIRSLRRRVWDSGNAPLCVIGQADDGFLGFTFDKRFVPHIDEETRRLICDIKRRHDNDSSFREIAEALSISRTKATRLLKKWQPEFDRPGEFAQEETPGVAAAFPPDETDAAEEWEDCDVEKPWWLDEFSAAQHNARSGEPPPPEEPVPKDRAPETPRSILLAHGCKLRLNEYDREIFVEREDERGKPLIWYDFDSKGKINRWEHWGFGNEGEKVDGPVCWLNTHYPLRC